MARRTNLVSRTSGTEAILRLTVDYFARKLAEHGPTARGVDWNSEHAQRVRLREIAPLLPATGSVIDYGSGYGALASYLRECGLGLEYWGYDLCEPMLAAARQRFADDPTVHFTSQRRALPRADWCVASGIFNLRMEASHEEWQDYILQTIDDMANLATRGIAFNALTSYSDPEKQRDDLHYSDPRALFDYCMRNFSQRVSVLHDYGHFDFTIVVRL
ncbi:MAG: SAM-dependent methyltransferase [Acidobacteria bacterium]|nr:SAM-dependent methyltransferase [Acidobacteriota bacterium]